MMLSELRTRVCDPVSHVWLSLFCKPIQSQITDEKQQGRFIQYSHWKRDTFSVLAKLSWPRCGLGSLIHHCPRSGLLQEV